MRSLPTQRTAAAAVLLALPLSLAACSSHSSHTAVKSASASSSTKASGAPSEKSGGGESSGEDGKPTKGQVAAGMTDYFVAKGVPRSLVNDVATCVADKGYGQFSDTTLRALKNGKVTELNPLDSAKLTKVTTNCLAGGKGGSLPTSVG